MRDMTCMFTDLLLLPIHNGTGKKEEVNAQPEAGRKDVAGNTDGESTKEANATLSTYPATPQMSTAVRPLTAADDGSGNKAAAAQVDTSSLGKEAKSG